MKKYLISYDVTNADYSALYDYIEKHENVHLTESFWAIKSKKDASTIRDDLTSCISKDSRIFVTKLDGYASWNVIDGSGLKVFYN